MKMIGLEESSLSWIFEHTVRQELFEDLPVVDLFLNGARGQEAIDGHLPRLTNTPRPLTSLGKKKKNNGIKTSSK